MTMDSCRVCGKSCWTELINPDGEVFFRCINCDWTVRNTPVEFTYDLSYFQGYLTSPGCQEFNRLAARSYLPPKPGRLLEIGCGLGHLLTEAKALGWKVFGLDICREACNHCLSKGLTEIRWGDFETVKNTYKNSIFDVVAMVHLIEHLLNPVEAIECCKRILADGGWLYIHTPDGEGFCRPDWGHHWEEHYSFFTAKTFNVLAKMLGLKVVRIEAISAGAELAVILGKSSAAGEEKDDSGN